MTRAAMILCAGLGTRLRPLTDWIAKPMVPIGDAPAVAHVASRLRAAGVPRLVLNVHHRPGDLRAWAADARVAISEEAELLGTAGGLARAAALLGGGDVIVWNGDILSDVDVTALVAAHEAAGADATLAVVPRERGQGNVGLAGDGRVVRLRGERSGEEASGADFIGVQVVGERARATLPERGCLVGDVHIPALRAGGRLAAYVVSGAFLDVGSVAAYVEANRAWLRARGARSWIDAGAVVSARTDGSIVGARARVDADAIDCVVWPGAHVRAPVRDAIVTPHGAVPIPSSARHGTS